MRGQKTSPQDIYNVLTSYAITQNLSETARTTGVPFGTVKNIVDRNRDTDEFKRVQDQKQEEFCEKASIIIDKILNRIEETIDDEEKDIPLNHLTTAMGTVYDKRALSRGDSTQNIDFATNFDIGKLLEISGYTKKDDNE